MNQKRIIYIITGFLCAISSSCKQKEQNTAQDIVKVKVVNPIVKSTDETITVNGTVNTNNQLVLSFKTGGVIGKVNTKEGDYVTKGTVLAAINTTELDTKLEQTNLNIEKLSRDLKRVQALVKDTIATVEQLQNIETNLDVAKQDKATIIYNKSQAVLTAPVSGFVIQQQASVGEYKNPGTAVITIAEQKGKDGHDRMFVAGLSDRNRVVVNEGQEVKIKLDVFPDKEFSGTIIQLSSVPNPKTGTYECTIAFNEQDNNVVFGLTGELVIPLAERQKHSILPLDAFVEIENEDAIIYVANANNQVEKKEVHVLQILDKSIVLVEMLSEKTNVITVGKTKVSTGNQVQIIN